MNSPLAGFVRRFFALCVDCLILTAAGDVITLPLTKKYDLDMAELTDGLMAGEVELLQQAAIFLLVYSLVVTLLWTFYFVYFTGSAGQTPGKKLLGIKVIRLNENNPEMDYRTAWTRFMGLTISASALMLGFVWALFDRQRQTWHDKMANTVVIKITSS